MSSDPIPPQRSFFFLPNLVINPQNRVCYRNYQRKKYHPNPKQIQSSHTTNPRFLSLSFGRLSPNSSRQIATAAGGYPPMTRRCSHCSNNGHNSRTCPTRSGTSTGGNGSGTKGEGGGGGVRLFGVRLTEGSGSMIMKKSASMGCLSHYSSMTSHGSSPNLLDSPSSDLMGDNDHDPEGYASDDPNHASCSANRRGERKKGIPWTEEEHRRFLVGLQKLGKGDWRGISRNYVVSRTPTQVASHAQKYFIRQTNASRRKRRSSLFDMPVDQVPLMEEQFLRSPPESESKNNLPSLDLSLEKDSTHAETITEKTTMELEENTSFTSLPPLVPAFYPAYFPMVYPYWPSSVSMPAKEESTSKTHVVLKPTPVLPKDPGHVDEVVGMSNLSIGEAGNSRLEPSALSSKLLSGSSSRQSAFHANPAASGSDINQTNSSNPIHAV